MANLMTAHVARQPVEKITVVSNGAALVAYTSGPSRTSAVPLLFLHAGVSDSRLWAKQFDTFAPNRRVVAYDRRGFGATAAVDASFSNVDDLVAVLDALGLDRVVLVGCSQGGRIALDATLARPDRVAALVLVAGAIGGSPEATGHDPRLEALMAAWDHASTADDLEAQNRIEAHVWLDGPFAPEGRVHGDARALFLTMNAIVLNGPKIGSAAMPDTAYARLDEIAVPTLVIWGALDMPSVVTHMRHAAATIPRARACELDDVAHLPSLEVPARFDEALAAFLRDAAPD